MRFIYILAVACFVLADFALSSGDCPDFSKNKPPRDISQSTPCQSDLQCARDEECCPYQGNHYCVPEKHEDDKKDDDHHHDCRDDDDNHKQHSKRDEKDGKKRKCENHHIRKTVFIMSVAAVGLVIIFITTLCCIKKCNAKKRRVNNSLTDLGTTKCPADRKSHYAVTVQANLYQEYKKKEKENEAMESWARQVLHPQEAPPKYSPSAPPAYTNAPPPSYHI